MKRLALVLTAVAVLATACYGESECLYGRLSPIGVWGLIVTVDVSAVPGDELQITTTDASHGHTATLTCTRPLGAEETVWECDDGVQRVEIDGAPFDTRGELGIDQVTWRPDDEPVGDLQFLLGYEAWYLPDDGVTHFGPDRVVIEVTTASATWSTSLEPEYDETVSPCRGWRVAEVEVTPEFG